MRVRRTSLLIGAVYALGYGAFTLYGCVVAYLELIALPMTTPVGRGILLLPGILAATVVGSGMALITRLTIPKRATAVSLLALTPTVAVLLSVVFNAGWGGSWWIELCDVVFLLLCTYGFAEVIGKRTFRQKSQRA